MFDEMYVEGGHHARSRLPAAFPFPGGKIEVKKSAFGLKRCHYVTADGTEQRLQPDRVSAEGRRAHLDRAHPALSRGISFLSTIVLLASLAVLVMQLLEKLIQPAQPVHKGRQILKVDLREI